MESILIAIAIVLFAFVLGFVVAPYLQKRGIITNGNSETAKQVIEIAKLILNNVEFKNKDRALVVLDVSSIAVSYVEQTAKNKSSLEKKELAKKSIIETLNVMEIEITNDVHAIIELGIESAVNRLPK